MKFSDGVWQTAEGMSVASPHHVFDLAVSETEVVIEAPPALLSLMERQRWPT